MIVVDTNNNVSGKLPYLKGEGVIAIGRYYSRAAGKRLTASEAQAIAAAGLKMFVVFEDKGDPPLDGDAGTQDAQVALQQAQAIGQPPGSAIYFAMEHLPNGYTAKDIPGVERYFQQVRSAFNGRYQVGVYSDGVVCDALLSSGLCDYAWLSASRGFDGTTDFYLSGRWSLAQLTPLDQDWEGLSIDANEAKPTFGEFTVGQMPQGGQAVSSQAVSSQAVPPMALMADAGGFIPVPFDPALALQYALFVKAAYSMYSADQTNLTPEPTSDFPAGYRLAAWVQMRDFLVFSTGPTFYGFMAQSTTDPSQFVLAIRGTETPEEWWDDLISMASTPFSVPDCGLVAFGFNRIYQTMEIVERPTGAPGAAVAARALGPVGSFAQQAASLVKRLSGAAAMLADGIPAQASVTVVGHSLGSALATLYTMENAHGDRIHNPTICTLASPRVGDATFAAAFAALPLTSWRIVNAPDVVPMLPPEIAGFRHVAGEQTYNSSKIAKANVACWHVLGTYLSLLDPQRQPDPGCRLLATGAEVAAAAMMAPVAEQTVDAAPTPAVAAAGDGSSIASLLRIAADSAQLQDAQDEAAKRLLAYDGEQYPSDGCAITLSVLLQEAGIDVRDTFQAIVLGDVLKARGWTQVPLGSQAAGDVGSTCGPVAHHGTDHIYLVLRPVNADEMVIADNQARNPHFRYVSGQGRSPTRFFLRAPAG